MYAVIHTGGKQYRVEPGQRLEVERLGSVDESIEFAPVLVVDGADCFAGPAQLAPFKVIGRVVGEAKGPKIDGFTYKNKTNQRKRWGHRQRYATIEITSIEKG